LEAAGPDSLERWLCKVPEGPRTLRGEGAAEWPCRGTREPYKEELGGVFCILQGPFEMKNTLDSPLAPAGFLEKVSAFIWMDRFLISWEK
jgi:hypothetical protein